MSLYFLSGLPRTGSTLLSSILSQNPDIHAEGNSALCQLMWDTQVSCETSAREQLLANNRGHTQDDILRAMPSLYYKNVSHKYIVDKCRSWTLPDNLKMIKRYITPNPKIIVLLRPIDDILRSFAKLRERNGIDSDTSDLTLPMSEPVMRSLYGIEFAMQNNNGEFLFVEYDDLVDYTEHTLHRIYEFCEWEPFTHNLHHIENKHPEDDAVYGLLGMHDVRSTIARKESRG